MLGQGPAGTIYREAALLRHAMALRGGRTGTWHSPFNLSASRTRVIAALDELIPSLAAFPPEVSTGQLFQALREVSAVARLIKVGFELAGACERVVLEYKNVFTSFQVRELIEVYDSAIQSIETSESHDTGRLLSSYSSVCSVVSTLSGEHRSFAVSTLLRLAWSLAAHFGSSLVDLSMMDTFSRFVISVAEIASSKCIREVYAVSIAVIDAGTKFLSGDAGAVVGRLVDIALSVDISPRVAGLATQLLARVCSEDCYGGNAEDRLRQLLSMVSPSGGEASPLWDQEACEWRRVEIVDIVEQSYRYFDVPFPEIFNRLLACNVDPVLSSANSLVDSLVSLEGQLLGDVSTANNGSEGEACASFSRICSLLSRSQYAADMVAALDLKILICSQVNIDRRASRTPSRRKLVALVSDEEFATEEFEHFKEDLSFSMVNSAIRVLIASLSDTLLQEFVAEFDSAKDCCKALIWAQKVPHLCVAFCDRLMRAFEAKEILCSGMMEQVYNAVLRCLATGSEATASSCLPALSPDVESKAIDFCLLAALSGAVVPPLEGLAAACYSRASTYLGEALLWLFDSAGLSGEQSDGGERLYMFPIYTPGCEEAAANSDVALTRGQPKNSEVPSEGDARQKYMIIALFITLLFKSQAPRLDNLSLVLKIRDTVVNSWNALIAGSFIVTANRSQGQGEHSGSVEVEQRGSFDSDDDEMAKGGPVGEHALLDYGRQFRRRRDDSSLVENQMRLHADVACLLTSVAMAIQRLLLGISEKPESSTGFPAFCAAYAALADQHGGLYAQVPYEMFEERDQYGFPVKNDGAARSHSLPPCDHLFQLKEGVFSPDISTGLRLCCELADTVLTSTFVVSKIMQYSDLGTRARGIAFFRLLNRALVGSSRAAQGAATPISPMAVIPIPLWQAYRRDPYHTAAMPRDGQPNYFSQDSRPWATFFNVATTLRTIYTPGKDTVFGAAVTDYLDNFRPGPELAIVLTHNVIHHLLSCIALCSEKRSQGDMGDSSREVRGQEVLREQREVLLPALRSLSELCVEASSVDNYGLDEILGVLVGLLRRRAGVLPPHLHDYLWDEIAARQEAIAYMFKAGVSVPPESEETVALLHIICRLEGASLEVPDAPSAVTNEEACHGVNARITELLFSITSVLARAQHFWLRVDDILPLLLLFCAVGQPQELRRRGLALLEEFSAASDEAIAAMLSRVEKEDVYTHVSARLSDSRKTAETLREAMRLYRDNPAALVGEFRPRMLLLSRLIGRKGWPAVSLERSLASSVLEDTVDSQHYQSVAIGDADATLSSLLCLAGV